MPSTSPGSPAVEPQLKFEALHGDLDRILQDETISCLCLSDKILALGTEEGRVHVLDYCGNQVSKRSKCRSSCSISYGIRKVP